ncbi:MAG TPA: hypothetical protein VFK33_07555 [Bacillales bacterium]|nr:hypothetical protein [Bacillales bacterium]
MPKFDVPLKRLVQRCPKDWVKFLVPNCPEERIQSIKTEKTPVQTSRLDEAFEIDDPGGSYILHFEPQVYHQHSFPVRMLRYRADIWESMMKEEETLKPIRQLAIFFFPEHENHSHRLTDIWDDDAMIDFTYKAVRIWEQDRRKVFQQNLVGLFPLLLLMRGETGESSEESVRQTAQAIQTVEDHALKMDLYAVFGIIGGNQFASDIIRTYVRREMLMESPIYNEWVEEERREAMKKEKRKIARKMLAKGKPLTEIMEFTGLPEEEIKKLR